MSSHLIAAVPIHGHVAPLLPIAAHLVARGDTVRFLTGSRFAEVVAATGATHVPLPADADFDDRDVVARFPEREGLSPLAALAFDIEHIFVRPAEGQYAAVQQLLAAAPVDAVIVDPLFLAGALLAELPAGRRPPVLVAGVVPLALPSRDLAPFGLGVPPLSGLPGRLRNGLLRAVNARVLRNAEAAGTAIMQADPRPGRQRFDHGLADPGRCRGPAVGAVLRVPATRTRRPGSSSPAWSPPRRRWSTRDRRGGPILTVLDPSCTSPRAPSPTTT